MAGLRPPVTDIGIDRPPTRRALALFALFGLLLLVMAFVGRLGVQSSLVTQAVILAALVLFLAVAIVAHGRRPADHYVADRAIRAAIGGLAAAGSLAGLLTIGLAAGLFSGSSDLLASACGLLAGMLLLALIAPALRRSGGYGTGDFLATRFGRTARLAGALVTFSASFLLLVAVLKTAAPLLTLLFGLTDEHALYATAALAALAALPGGMRSLTLAQMAQYLLMLLACLLPIGFLTAGPEGSGLAGLAEIVSPAGLAAPFSALFQSDAITGAAVPLLLLGAGAASLPPMLARGFAARSGPAAGATMVWSAIFMAALVVACVALGRALAGAIGTDADAALAGDILSRAVPLLSALPPLLFGLLMAGALAALLSAGQAALVSAGTALSLDVWDTFLDPKGPAGRRIVIARLILVAVAAAGAWAAAGGPADPPALLGWALAIAAAGSFTPLVLGLAWRRCNEAGAVFGTIAGFGIAFVMFLIDLRAVADGTVARFGLSSTAAAGCGVLVSFAVAILASLVGRVPQQKAAAPGRSGGREAPPMRERPA